MVGAEQVYFVRAGIFIETFEAQFKKAIPGAAISLPDGQNWVLK